MTRARDLAKLGNPNIISADSNFNVGIGSLTPDAKLDVAGIVSATAFYGDGSNLSGITAGATLSAGSGSQRIVVTSLTSGTMTSAATDAELVYNSDTNTLTATTFSGALSGNATGLSGTPNIDVTNITGVAATFSGNVSVGGTLTYEDVTNVDSVGVVTARSGIKVGAGQSISAVSGTIYYYGDGSNLEGIAAGGSGEFNTGITSSVVMNPLGYATTMFTFPATAGKQYVINSLNAANVYSGLSTANLIAWVQDSSGNPTYIAYNVPITNGGLVEVLKNPFVAGPSDEIHMWTTNTSYSGIINAVEAYMNYTENDSTEYISVYYQSSSTTTDAVGILTSTTYPSNLQSIRLTNRTDTGDYPVSVSITSGVVTTYLAKDLIIPRYAVVDILDRQKRIEINDVVKVSVAQTASIDVIIAGKQITS